MIEQSGCRVQRLPALPALPDAVFVEDTALVLDELAVITRPGAESRRPETDSVARALEAYRPLRFIEPPGTLDGGDVLRVGRQVYVGLTLRSNADGIAQLRTILEPFGYQVTAVAVDGCLHLKTAVTQVAERTLLINPQWVAGEAFRAYSWIEVDPAEPQGANALLLNGHVIYPDGFPRTQTRLVQAGIQVRTVEASELTKAEGGVTCCSLIVRA